jgi:uncharacterized cupin superfamily protein
MENATFYADYRVKPVLLVAGLLIWSALVFFAGGALLEPSKGYSFSLIKTAQADSDQTVSKQIVPLDRGRLAGKNLGDYAPYEPQSGNLMARGHEYFYSDDENFALGVWESKSGEMTYNDLAYDELMVLLDGALIMTDTQGKSETYTAGEGLVLPKGWSGTLAVPEGGVRKIWVSYLSPGKGLAANGK